MKIIPCKSLIFVKLLIADLSKDIKNAKTLMSRYETAIETLEIRKQLHIKADEFKEAKAISKMIKLRQCFVDDLDSIVKSLETARRPYELAAIKIRDAEASGRVTKALYEQGMTQWNVHAAVTAGHIGTIMASVGLEYQG